jgi:hypothetical protein
MKTKLISLCVLLTITSISFGQQNSSLENWNWLMGEWIGEGSGQPGKGGGTFSFSYDLDKKIIVRKSHSEYPPVNNKPAVIHDDLMIIYTDFNGNQSKAIYFDNEGHTINYQITYSEKSIVLTSVNIPIIPIFRLTYSLVNSGTIDTKFEMSQDGEKFMIYIEGRSQRTD